MVQPPKGQDTSRVGLTHVRGFCDNFDIPIRRSAPQWEILSMVLHSEKNPCLRIKGIKNNRCIKFDQKRARPSKKKKNTVYTRRGLVMSLLLSVVKWNNFIKNEHIVEDLACDLFKFSVLLSTVAFILIKDYLTSLLWTSQGNANHDTPLPFPIAPS